MYMPDTTRSYNEMCLYYLGTYCSAVEALGPVLIYCMWYLHVVFCIQTMLILYVRKHIIYSILLFMSNFHVTHNLMVTSRTHKTLYTHLRPFSNICTPQISNDFCVRYNPEIKGLLFHAALKKRH